jgi:mRNA interferase MazF
MKAKTSFGFVPVPSIFSLAMTLLTSFTLITLARQLSNRVAYAFGKVLLLEYPSSDLRSVKIRPVIVLLDTGDDDFLVAKVTSQSARDDFDAVLLDWEEGLRTESYACPHKLFTLDKALIVRNL